ncbi:MAG: hypothetical protein GEU90_19505 [Gemmatimonas sp.]|nr:hypothetical protein [Gemmatimonas sp.]
MDRFSWRLGLRGLAVALSLAGASVPALAQTSPHPTMLGRPGDQLPPGQRGSSNLHLLSNLPLGGFLHVSDIEIEQELSRPFVYISKRFHPYGLDILDIEDPTKPKLIHSWRIENSELHQGSGPLDGKSFKHDGRYYFVQSVQFQQGGPDSDLAAIVFDVTGLPDPTKVQEVARIHAPDTPGGFHNIFMYKHSDGRPLLFTTTNGPHANVYDMSLVVSGKVEEALAARIDVPQTAYWALQGGQASYHDFYVAYDPISGQDRFWGGGTGGYFVLDISNLEQAELLVALTGIAGVNQGHTFTPTPDGRYAVGETEYQYAPLRVFDLTPAWEEGEPTISRPVGAWTANWKNLAHNHEMRWPYVFVSAYEDGLQIFNIMDPTDPYTVAYYDTYDGPHMARGSNNVNMGAWGVDIRNEDGLIVVSDMMTGFWAFRMDGFSTWSGEQWGMPNVSSVQDWENGPQVSDDL